MKIDITQGTIVHMMIEEKDFLGHCIVLSGEAGAGKDTVAKFLVEERGWEIYSLAAPLKRFAEDMFGFTKEQCYGPSSARNAPDPRWTRPCPRCDKKGLRPAFDGVPDATIKRFVPCEDCEGQGTINDNSPRRVLQLLGEEYLRQMIHVDALTMRACPEISGLLARGKNIVVNDARNDNDRNNLHDWLGAKRVDVRSNRCADKRGQQGWRQHASETRLATDDQVEFIIQNDEEWPFPALPMKIRQMLVALFGTLS